MKRPVRGGRLLGDLRVGIDVAPLALTRAGTARHVRSLLAALEQEEGLELRRYGFGGGARALVPARDLAWYLAALPALAFRDRLALLHCPTFRAPVKAPVPLVVTFHDLAVLRHPDTFNRWPRTYSRTLLPGVARSAARIIAVSEFTRGELIELLDVPDEKIRVVPNGIDAAFGTEGPASEGDYVLAVSTLEPRKNLPRLVEACSRVALDGLELRVVGAPGWGSVRIGGKSVRWLGELPDAELARLYRGAACVAYPSLYEGFGLPVLEAMACGAPVVCANGGGPAEVAGNAAVLVDALDPEAIAAGLLEAIARREELGSLGRVRAAAFAWESAAEATLAVYREVAE